MGHYVACVRREKFVGTVLGHSRDGTASEPKLKRNVSRRRREIENSRGDRRKDSEKEKERERERDGPVTLGRPDA